MWFSLAAGQGDANGMQRRDAVSRGMKPSQIAEAGKLVRQRQPAIGDRN